MSNYRVVLCALLVAALSKVACADQFSLAPNASFYLNSPTDTIVNPAIVQLSSLSFPVHTGDTIVITRQGFIQFNSGDTAETGSSISAVFSSTNTLLDKTNLNRVTGAIDAGVDFTSPTSGGSATDITQDFLVDDAVAGLNRHFSSVSIQVPQGANYLFVGVVDSPYSDNADKNSDFGFSITATPEPASLTLLGAGALALLGRRRKQARAV